MVAAGVGSAAGDRAPLPGLGSARALAEVSARAERGACGGSWAGVCMSMSTHVAGVSAIASWQETCEAPVSDGLWRVGLCSGKSGPEV